MISTWAKEMIKAGLRRAGYEIRKRSRSKHALGATGHFASYLDDRGVNIVLDVGGNAGRFGQELRSVGFSGRIISFEPLSSAHAQLTRSASGDANWNVAPRAAVGAQRGEAEINIADNSQSSSLLPMLGRHLEGAPGSAYRGREHCSIICLDEYIDSSLPGSDALGLKIDTQGFEEQVLRGVQRHLARVKVVLLEMSLTQLYAQAPSIEQLHRWLTERGLVCVALHPAFVDAQTDELLQVDGLFVRVAYGANAESVPPGAGDLKAAG